jgi:Ca-activated chloride channel homolog
MQMMASIQKYCWLISIVLLCVASYLKSQNHTPQVPSFKVDVDTVFLKVAVTDPFNRCVVGLEKEQFTIYEDNVEQHILHFGQQDAPISVAVVVDISASMAFTGNAGIGRNWFARFLKTLNPEDEYFLVTFNQDVNSFHAGAELQNDFAVQKPQGWTALYDAVYSGLELLSNRKNANKALILITDGEENRSRYTASDVRELCKESDVQIYGIALPGPKGYGRNVLKQIVVSTGGRVFSPNRAEELDSFSRSWADYIDLIGDELRRQYVLGYVPTNRTRDGKWRRIRVKLDAPQGLPKLSIRTREGYYAPKI